MGDFLRQGYKMNTYMYLLVLPQVRLNGDRDRVVFQFASVQQLLQEQPVSLSPLCQLWWHFRWTGYPRLNIKIGYMHSIGNYLEWYATPYNTL